MANQYLITVTKKSGEVVQWVAQSEVPPEVDSVPKDVLRHRAQREAERRGWVVESLDVSEVQSLEEAQLEPAQKLRLAIYIQGEAASGKTTASNILSSLLVGAGYNHVRNYDPDEIDTTARAIHLPKMTNIDIYTIMKSRDGAAFFTHDQSPFPDGRPAGFSRK